jgi:hypothetical protein
MFADTGNRLSAVVDSQGLGPAASVMQLSFPGRRRAVPPRAILRSARRPASTEFACFRIFL